MLGQVLRLMGQAAPPLLLSPAPISSLTMLGGVIHANFANLASSPTPSPRKGRVMPRVLHHMTKKQFMDAADLPEANDAGPLQSIMRASEDAAAMSSNGTTSSTTASSSQQPTYEDLPIWNQIKHQGSSDESRMELARLLRRYNYSLPGLQGQAILAKVLRVNKDNLLVDPGFYGVAEVPRADVTLASVHTEGGESSSAATGSAAGSAGELAGRSGLSDVRAGDTVSLRVEALFTPYGDMALGAAEAEPTARRAATWRELAEARMARKPVLGRVLNACTGGYAVGVGGIVALLPYGRFTLETVSAVGTLQPFMVEMLDAVRGLVSVADVRKGASKRLI